MRTVGLVGLVGVVLGVGVWVAQPSAPTPTPAPAVGAPTPVVNADIALFERRAQEDRWSAADRAVLARLYLQRGRETGEYADFQRAESAARSSLFLRRERNDKSVLLLASSLLAQHRFVEARAAAQELVAAEPGQIGSRALLAEILLELGDYAAADDEFKALSAFEENLAVAPRLARWHELRGRNSQARTILLRSAEAARSRSDLPPEQVAWFHLRVADHALRTGQLREARRAIGAGLAANPGDFRLRSARARLAAARQQWRKVVSEVEQLGDQADLATLALAGDAARESGDRERAEDFYRQVERQARARPEPFARQWTQFCLEHNRHAAETLSTLEQEIRSRPDVLGHELLAWAYHKAGRQAEAETQIRAALRLGTQDALLQHLAGRLLDDPARLTAARRINPHLLVPSI